MIPTLPRNPRYAIIGVLATDHSLVAEDGYLSAWLGLPLQNILPNRSNPNAELPKTPTGLRGWLVRSTYGRMDLRRAEWHGWKPGNLSAADLESSWCTGAAPAISCGSKTAAPAACAPRRAGRTPRPAQGAGTT